jgi:hypothetical protein
MTNEELRQIVKEEIRAILMEQTRNWWTKPAEAELDTHLEPSEVHEEMCEGEGCNDTITEQWYNAKAKILAERAARAPVGKKFTGKTNSDGTKQAVFTSAGSIGSRPWKKPFKDGPKGPKYYAREEIGKYLLSRYRRGGAEGQKYRNSIINRTGGNPEDKEAHYSRIWADASSAATNGATLSDMKKKTAKQGKAKRKATRASKKNQNSNTP